MTHAALRVGALLLPHDADRLTLEPAKAGDDGLVLAEGAVAGQRREIGQELARVFGKMRALWMPRDQDLLRGRQRRVKIGERLGGFRLQLVQFVGDGDRVALAGELAQLLDFCFQFGDRLFEIEI